MAIYPAMPKPELGSSGELYVPVVKTESDGNYIRVRRKTTKSREVFTLQYRTSHADFELIKTFFTTYQGSAFQWTHPLTGAIHTVVFGMDKLQRTMREYSEFTVILEEL